MKIKNIELKSFSSSFGRTKSLGSSKSLKIISLVKVITDNKEIGYGEIYLGIYVPPELIKSILDIIKKFLLNKNISKLIENKFFPHIPFVSRNGMFNSIYSGVDIALWDIYSKIKKKPLHQCISNLNNNYKIYSSGGMIKDKVSDLIHDINLASDLKHSGFKIRAGYFSWNSDMKKILIAKKMTEEKNMSLMVDMIMGTINPPLKFKDYKKKTKFLEKMKLKWIKEPFHPDDIESFKKLKNLKKIIVASGEALNGKLEYDNYIKNKLVNIIQLDVTHCGGITKAIEILELAKKRNLQVALHVWGSKIAQIANSHLALAFENVKWLECPIVEPEINKFIITKTKEKKHLAGQDLDLGLGIQINERLIKKKFRYVKNSEYKI